MHFRLALWGVALAGVSQYRSGGMLRFGLHLAGLADGVPSPPFCVCAPIRPIFCACVRIYLAKLLNQILHFYLTHQKFKSEHPGPIVTSFLEIVY